jgi:hypothetical protein
MVTGGQDRGDERWQIEQQQIDRAAEQARMEHEVERAEADKAAERGEPAPVKKPWWKFWSS